MVHVTRAIKKIQSHKYFSMIQDCCYIQSILKKKHWNKALTASITFGHHYIL